MNTAEKIIEFHNVQFTYTDEQSSVLHYLNCAFMKNRINLLLGPSGCGKSTALYMLNGIVPYALEGQYEGSVLVKGEAVLGKTPQQLSCKTGFVFQDPESQFCTFTVEDEIAFGLENINIPRQHIAPTIHNALALVGMEGTEKCLLSKLSGGQKQKIAIAAVLAMEPEIIVLDEPTANLDPAATAEIFALLAELVEKHHKTLIVVEHKLDGFMDKVQHMVLMDANGSAQLSGPTNHVLARLIYDHAYDHIQVFLPEHLLIIKSIFACLGHQETIAALRQQLLQEALQQAEQPYAYGLNYGAAMLVQIAQTLGLMQFSEVETAATKGEPLLEINGLGFSYEKNTKKTVFKRPPAEPAEKDLLENLNFTVKKGDFAAILGPNGAGKSTLLNLIFQVQPHYRGQILLNGKDIASLNKQALYQTLGLVFQNPEWQFVTNEVQTELLFSLKNTTLTEAEKALKIEAVLHQFHLEKDKQKSPFLLSQGQKRRLSVAAMLLTGQKILFLDEPTYGQDYENQLELMELMRKLNREGITIVLVSHDMSLVADYVDTVHLLQGGKIQFSGTPEALFANSELVQKGRLQKPIALELSERIQKSLPQFPLFISKEKMIRLFCGQNNPTGSKEGGNAHVCI